MGDLYAISDLHVGHRENREHVAALRPAAAGDWLIVAGDVAERISEIEWALGTLARHWEKVVWVPGNHELWTPPGDPPELRGDARYRHLVAACRRLGVVTPEDPFPVWESAAGPVTVVPLFLLYDYTFLPEGATTKEEGLRLAYESGVVCTDERYLHPDPYPSLDAWCAARLAAAEERLAALPPGARTVLVNHWPMTRDPTAVLWYPEFAQWCGTVHTADWHVRFGAEAVVYGHLHIPRTLWIDGVRFEEVSVGYPREWRRGGGGPRGPVRVLEGANSVRSSGHGAILDAHLDAHGAAEE